jgi:hypothetical protein
MKHELRMPQESVLGAANSCSSQLTQKEPQFTLWNINRTGAPASLSTVAKVCNRSQKLSALTALDFGLQFEREAEKAPAARGIESQCDQ